MSQLLATLVQLNSTVTFNHIIQAQYTNSPLINLLPINNPQSLAISRSKFNQIAFQVIFGRVPSFSLTISESKFSNSFQAVHLNGKTQRRFESETRVEILGNSFDNLRTPAADGGALHLVDCESFLRNNFFFDCTANFGGAFYGTGYTTEIRKCSFSRCQAINGGAIALKNGQLHLIQTVFYSCQAKETGGVIYMEDSDVYFARNTYHSNNAQFAAVAFFKAITGYMVDESYTQNNASDCVLRICGESLDRLCCELGLFYLLNETFILPYKIDSNSKTQVSDNCFHENSFMISKMVKVIDPISEQDVTNELSNTQVKLFNNQCMAHYLYLLQNVPLEFPPELKREDIYFEDEEANEESILKGFPAYVLLLFSAISGVAWLVYLVMKPLFKAQVTGASYQKIMSQN